MTTHTVHPLIYEVYAHVWQKEWAQKRGHPLDIGAIPDEALDTLAAVGVEWLWLMGVWQTGLRGLSIARTHPQLRTAYTELLGPGLSEVDIVGSPYAIQSYTVHQSLGGPAALATLRARLAERGIKLMLDFVPNHTATDHPWTTDHPEYYVLGSDADIKTNDAFMSECGAIIRHGRDPHFPSWSDTAQLDWRNPETIAALRHTLLDIAAQCDGLRCDMAMLLLRDVFASTWGAPPARPTTEPWVELLDAVLREHKDFAFAAEAYWGLEESLIALGFTWAYDKSLYDKLLSEDAWSVREHLLMDERRQRQRLRFLENHDEDRAAARLSHERHRAAAVLCATLPGAWLIHHGQLEGRRIKSPVQLGRWPHEHADLEVEFLYRSLLEAIQSSAIRNGGWSPLACKPAWGGNSSSDQFVAHAWSSAAGLDVIVAVNFAPLTAQCYIELPLARLPTTTELLLVDALTKNTYARKVSELRAKGLYCELPPWGAHLFLVKPQS